MINHSVGEKIERMVIYEALIIFYFHLSIYFLGTKLTTTPLKVVVLFFEQEVV
jgi:hypothetical protein